MTKREFLFGYDIHAKGVDRARAWMEQRFPGGFFERLGVYPVAVEEGRLELALDVDVGHANFINTVHGGVLAALVDIAGAGAAMTTAGVGEALLTTDLNLRLLDTTPVHGERLTAIGQVAHRAKKRLVVSVEIRRGDGTLVAEGSIGALMRGA
jgi:uncharacterized protein (TIGR00369 family)